MSLFADKATKEMKRLAVEQQKMRNKAIFEKFSALPICIPCEVEQDDTIALINLVNGTLLIAYYDYMEIRIRGVLRSRKTLTEEEALRALNVWTILARPYHMIDWEVEDTTDPVPTALTSAAI